MIGYAVLFSKGKGVFKAQRERCAVGRHGKNKMLQMLAIPRAAADIMEALAGNAGRPW